MSIVNYVNYNSITLVLCSLLVLGSVACRLSGFERMPPESAGVVTNAFQDINTEVIRTLVIAQNFPDNMQTGYDLPLQIMHQTSEADGVKAIFARIAAPAFRFQRVVPMELSYYLVFLDRRHRIVCAAWCDKDSFVRVKCHGRGDQYFDGSIIEFEGSKLNRGESPGLKQALEKLGNFKLRVHN